MKCLRGLAVLLTAALAACCLPATALASGGADIASATTVAYGQQQFGNTATDSCVFPGSLGQPEVSWWLLPVTAGDKATIDLETTSLDGPAALFAKLWPVGTTDFNVNTASPFQEVPTKANGKAEMVVPVMPRSGTMPLQFLANGDGCGAGTGGPYDFTARVEHRLVVSLSAAGVNRPLHRTRFLLGVHNPDGVPVSDPRLRYDVERLTGGRWFTIARHRPPFAFTWRWPRAQRGRRQSIRVQLHGPGYLTATSRAVRVSGV